MSFNPDERLQFDELTRRMTDIGAAGADAPVEHLPYYQAAFQHVHGEATEVLSANPELEAYYRKAGQMVLQVSGDAYQALASLRHLQAYAEQGLVEEADINQLGNNKVADAFDYSQPDFEAFEQLFPTREAMPADEVPNGKPEGNEQQADGVEETTDVDLSEEINNLDILEFLAEQGLTNLQCKLIERALSGEAVSLDRLRREEWEFMSLTKDEYADLFASFEPLRIKVAALLKGVNVPAKWVQPNAKDKKYYQLLIGIEADEAEQVDPRAGLKHKFGQTFGVTPTGRERPSAPSEEPTEATRQVQVSKPAGTVKINVPAARFAQDVLQVAQAILQENPNAKLSTIASEVGKAMGLLNLVTRSALMNLVDSGDLFYGPSIEGSRTLLTEPPTEPIAKGRQRKASNGEEEVNQAGFTDTEMKLAHLLCSDLIRSRYQNKGLTLQNVVTALGVEEKEAKKLVSRLVERERLVREVRTIKTRGGSRSRANRETTWVKFPSQEAWDEYRANPTEYLDVMREDRTAAKPEAEANGNGKHDPAFSIDELVLAGSIFDAVVSVGQQNKGIPLQDLTRALGMPEEAGRAYISRIVNRGLLARDLAWERSRSAMSRRKQTVFIKLPTMEAWKAYRENPGAYLAGLKEEY